MVSGLQRLVFHGCAVVESCRHICTLQWQEGQLSRKLCLSIWIDCMPRPSMKRRPEKNHGQSGTFPVTWWSPFHAVSFRPSKVYSHWKIHIVWNSMTVFFLDGNHQTDRSPSLIGDLLKLLKTIYLLRLITCLKCTESTEHCRRQMQSPRRRIHVTTLGFWCFISGFKVQSYWKCGHAPFNIFFFGWKEGVAAEFFWGRWFLGEDLLDKFLQTMFDDFPFDLYIKHSYKHPNILHGWHHKLDKLIVDDWRWHQFRDML